MVQIIFYQDRDRVEGWWAGKARPERRAVKDIDKFIQKIEEAKTYLADDHRNKEWIDGFNAGLDWAIRILVKDKSAY